MKRLITCAICILCITIVKANTRLITDSATHTKSNNYPKASRDTIKPPVLARTPALPGYLQIFKSRLDSIQKDVQLDYNEYVQSYIDVYTRHKDEMGHVLGLAQYYFPIYEKAFREAGIPEEIEYLSIVESKLDPAAISRVGATGPWQFMPATAKLYGLNMDGYVDERRDPIQASYAAAAYLKDAYLEFGDWLLAIASYNCGKSNVEHAIEKAGGAMDFWSIRQYLPNETRGYVPAFIATAYVMNYAGKHDISPIEGSFNMNTDTVFVDRFVSLSNVSRVLNVDTRELIILNPAYKKQIVNGSVAAPRRLVIPKTATSNYAALYDVLNTDMPAQPAFITAVKKSIPEYHKVKKGETLNDIADNYGLDPQDLKDWNNLHSGKDIAGKKLWLNDAHEVAEKPSLKFITYTVKPGDNLSVIAAKFDGATVDSIKLLNGLKKGPLQPGMKLKISRG